MTKEEFLVEASLRLIASRPQACMSEIADMARELTECVFNTTTEMEHERTRWWDKDVENSPSDVIISRIKRTRRHTGYAARLMRTFRSCNIKTAGDLLRIGRMNFRKYQDIGAGTISSIDDALEELYGIKDW